MDNMFNGSFSFTDCVFEAESSIASAAFAGTQLGRHFRRFYAACDSFSRIPQLYALCSGIAAAGGDVCVCENSDLPSMRFSIPLVSADCGIFLSGSSSLRAHIFGGNRLPLAAELLADIFSGSGSQARSGCGRITSVTSFGQIYTGNVLAALGEKRPAALISCGQRSVRELWQSVFAEDSSLAFNVSGEGLRVSAFSERCGLVNAERLILAYARIFGGNRTIWLPENFHFSAERSGLDIRRFTDSTDDEFSLRMLTDPLYVCAMLAAERERTLAALSELPELSQVRREVPVSFCETTPFRRIIVLPEGRLLLSRCGRERLLIAAQADSMEAAAELCEVWESRLRRGGEAALR